MGQSGMLRRALPAMAVVAAIGWAVWAIVSPPERPDEVRASLSLAETLGGADTVGYARAFEPRAFEFPADHGPHPDFRTEWWYFTGNLDAEDGRRFGFQFTIFRSALAPADPASSSAWATRQMYLGHFTVTDVARGRFTEFERFTRGAAGLAGAQAPQVAAVPPVAEAPQVAAVAVAPARPFRVWLDDWELRGPDPESAAGTDTAWPMTLTAADAGVALSLVFEPIDGIVLQGDRGLSQKGPEPGNASLYYSYPRIDARGTLTLDGEAVAVRGLAWLDREWSTSALSEGQVGWDWFSLQLDDDSELMVYQLRRADGSADPMSKGAWIAPDGTKVPLASGDYTLTPTGSWASPVDGARYPSGWRVAIPRLGLELDVQPVLADQELDVTVRYWEGAVDVTGTREGRPVAGRGYVELTGYANGR